MRDEVRNAALIFAIVGILIYLLAVSCYPTLEAITATPTPTVDILSRPRSIGTGGLFK